MMDAPVSASHRYCAPDAGRASRVLKGDAEDVGLGAQGLLNVHGHQLAFGVAQDVTHSRAGPSDLAPVIAQ
jgi:hypothetical protein